MTIARTLTSEAEANTPAASEQAARPLSTLLRLPKVQLAIASVLISQTVMVVIMVMTPLHMDHHHHSRDAISLVISAHTLGMFAFSPLTGYLIDRFGRIPMLVVGAMTMIASALLAPVSATEFSLAIALFLLGLGWNFGYVSGSSLLADALQGAERARVQGVNDSLVFFAAGFGSLAAGSLFASGGRRREHGGAVAGCGDGRHDLLVQPPPVPNHDGLAASRASFASRSRPPAIHHRPTAPAR
ncbi:MAG: MFS transporter [Anaerolineae bacterium]|nr:MFS transporter [Anaerolineae bacterium]